MGPTDMFFSWPPLILAMIVYMLTQFIKTFLDSTMGQDARKANVRLTRLILPALPPVLGALVALGPVRPDSLVAHAQAAGLDWHEAQFLYSAWGATCGQFADYMYTKIKAFVQDQGIKKGGA